MNCAGDGPMNPYRRVLRSIRMLVRAVTLLLTWSPVALSGCIIAVLSRHRLLPESWRIELRESWWRALLKLIEFSGPTFIKAAQWVSTRRDSVPEEVCNRLGRLHTFTKSRPRSYGEDALDLAFGLSWRRSFELEEEALGSGCVAQVYKGRMIGGLHAGRAIAVKIVDSSLRMAVDCDLGLMRATAAVLELVPRLHWLSLRETVNEFGHLMETQLDLRREARNLERFREDFRDDPSLVFPSPMYPWVSDSVLVEDFKEGEPISTFFGGEESRQLASMGLQMFLKMVFINNFVHGDLHPGNLLVGRQQEGRKPCLIILDAGIVSELDESDRKNFVDLFYAIVVGDGKLAGRLMIERARDQRCRDPEGFCTEVDTLVQKARSSGLRLGQIQAGQLLTCMFSLCLQHEVKLESKFSSVVLAIAVLEGVGRSLDPDCNILKETLPVVARASTMQLGL